VRGGRAGALSMLALTRNGYPMKKQAGDLTEANGQLRKAVSVLKKSSDALRKIMMSMPNTKISYQYNELL
jgi:hypothetical protein